MIFNLYQFLINIYKIKFRKVYPGGLADEYESDKQYWSNSTLPSFMLLRQASLSSYCLI